MILRRVLQSEKHSRGSSQGSESVEVDPLFSETPDILRPFLRAVALTSDDELREGSRRGERLLKSEIPRDEVGVEGGIRPVEDREICSVYREEAIREKIKAKDERFWSRNGEESGGV